MVRNSLGKIVKSSIFVIGPSLTFLWLFFSFMKRFTPTSSMTQCPCTSQLCKEMPSLSVNYLNQDSNLMSREWIFWNFGFSRLAGGILVMNKSEGRKGYVLFAHENKWSSEVAFIRSSYPSEGIIIWILEYLDSSRKERLLNFFKANIVTHFNLSLWRK